jgi:hypothetical protein
LDGIGLQQQEFTSSSRSSMLSANWAQPAGGSKGSLPVRLAPFGGESCKPKYKTSRGHGLQWLAGADLASCRQQWCAAWCSMLAAVLERKVHVV